MMDHISLYVSHFNISFFSLDPKLLLVDVGRVCPAGHARHGGQVARVTSHGLHNEHSPGQQILSSSVSQMSNLMTRLLVPVAD